MQSALVLEGGGTRGVYTAGVLEVLHSENIIFDYIIGTSMGACNAASFISNQPKRNKRVTVDYINDKRYMNLMNFIRKDKSVFGMDFLFQTIPNQLDPFDYHAYKKSEVTFYAVATDVDTGNPVYLSKNEAQTNEEIMKMIKASCSLPGLAPAVEYQNRMLLDGGIADSVPIQRAIADGNDKIIVVLTRDASYRKKPLSFKSLYKRKFKEHKGFCEALINRYKEYNETVEFIDKLERQGQIIVIRPSEPINIGRFEKKKEVFDKIHALGKKDIRRKIHQVKRYLNDEVLYDSIG